MRASGLSAAAAAVFVAAFVAAPGCGSDDDPPPTEDPGPEDNVECTGVRCDPVQLPGNYPEIAACCAEGGVCGLDGTQFEQYGANFENNCQARDQPGDRDPACPASTPVPTDFGMLFFDGCCTPAGRCGYMVDSALSGIVQLGLGCVDAEPFLEGGTPPACTPGSPGAGGGGGQ